VPIKEGRVGGDGKRETDEWKGNEKEERDSRSAGINYREAVSYGEFLPRGVIAPGPSVWGETGDY